MLPATYDFTWVRGSTTPLRLTFMVAGVAIPYDDIRLSVFKGKVLAFRQSLLIDGASSGLPGTVKENATGDVSFIPTAAQTRSLTQTANDGSIGKNSYEVEVRNGADEEIYLLGTIAAIGGLNDDEVS